MKVVINACYGGFSLSDEALHYYLKLKGEEYEEVKEKFYIYFYIPSKLDYDKQVELDTAAYDLNSGNEHGFSRSSAMRLSSHSDFERSDPLLVQTVKHLGSKDASGDNAKLKIITIPDDIKWQVKDYNGFERVEEVHRSWS